MGKKKNIALRAAYMNKVRAFAPLKDRDRNRLSGAIGVGECASTKRKPVSANRPSATGPKTCGSRHPNREDCSRPYTTPQRPAVTRMAPGISKALASPL